MKYIAYYDINDNKENRKYVLAATNKIDYICKAINSIGQAVKIVSVAMTKNNKCYKGKTLNINEGTILKLFPTIWGGNKLCRIVSAKFMRVYLFTYLLFNTKKNENILIYHSVGYGNAIHWAKKLKKFKIILEVEEIYQDISSLGEAKNAREYRDFADADKYIFPTEMLNDKINTSDKPYAVIHGTYKVEDDRGDRFADDKIHVVYAGTFEPRKGSVAAVSAVEWLPENYHMHIIGFGSDRDTENIKQLIKETNEKSKATVTYDGLLSGEEYIRFIQKCHIGLSTQNPDASFNATSFPSKILSYMANGLRVVSIRIPAIETSDIGNDMYYYEKQTPKEIAKAIMAVDIYDDYNGRAKVEELDKKFTDDLNRVLKEA